MRKNGVHVWMISRGGVPKRFDSLVQAAIEANTDPIRLIHERADLLPG